MLYLFNHMITIVLSLIQSSIADDLPAFMKTFFLLRMTKSLLSINTKNSHKTDAIHIYQNIILLQESKTADGYINHINAALYPWHFRLSILSINP